MNNFGNGISGGVPAAENHPDDEDIVATATLASRPAGVALVAKDRGVNLCRGIPGGT